MPKSVAHAVSRRERLEVRSFAEPGWNCRWGWYHRSFPAPHEPKARRAGQIVAPGVIPGLAAANSSSPARGDRCSFAPAGAPASVTSLPRAHARGYMLAAPLALRRGFGIQSANPGWVNSHPEGVWLEVGEVWSRDRGAPFQGAEASYTRNALRNHTSCHASFLRPGCPHSDAISHFVPLQPHPLFIIPSRTHD